jgi:predicted sugar kinase
LPAEWRFVLACPKTAAGAAGESESAAFRALPPFPQELTDRLSRILLTEILPACRTADFESFATALGLYGQLVGEAFEKMQGGIVHPVSQSLFNELAQRGFSGVAQTSWGPTLAILQPSQVAAEGLLLELQNLEVDSPLELRVVQPRNTGAKVKIQN